MIDTANETLVSLREAAEFLPNLRGGRKPHIGTMYRWSATGIDGVRLETVNVGGAICTSNEALHRFFQAVTAERSEKRGRK